jgi:nucleotide-binding universal stress UspA family protein
MDESPFTIAVPLGIRDDPQAWRQLLDLAAALMPPMAGDPGLVVGVNAWGADQIVLRSSIYFPTVAASPSPYRPWGEAGPRLEMPLPVDPLPPTGWAGVVEAVREARADLLLLDWEAWSRPSRQLFGVSLDEVVRTAPCDVATVRRGGLGRVRQVLLPVRGGPQGLLTLRLAMGLAERHDATITLLHVEQPGLLPDDDTAVRAQLDALLARGAHPTRAEPAIVIADSVEAAIAVEAEAHQVTIMGASPGDPGTPLLLGPVAEAVAAQAPGTLIIVKARE